MDMVFSATIRSRRRAAAGGSAAARDGQLGDRTAQVEVGFMSASALGRAPGAFHRLVDRLARLLGAALRHVDGVVLQLVAAAVEVDELVVHDE